ncbi:MAG: SEL1-like repeat protein [Victivallaceae bacterium]
MLKTALVFLSFLSAGNWCLAGFNTDNDFTKYGFTEHRNILIDRSLWGYRLAYSKTSANTCAYVLAKIPTLEKSPLPVDKITFRFKARLYPVAPETKDMERVIKAYVKKSLGVTKVQKTQKGVMCAPLFVVSENNGVGKKGIHRVFPIQYSKRSDKVTEIKKAGDPVKVLFRDTRLLPVNLFRNREVEVVFDYLNNIVSYNCNGNKIILRDESVMNVWNYFGLATFFTPIGPKKTTVIALEYEFTSIKMCLNGKNIESGEDNGGFPRMKCSYYKDIIKKKKDIDAMYCLGLNFYEGKGGAEKDYYQAFKWFKEAARQEHVLAQYYLGLCYLYGRGTSQDNSKAWKWLLHASKYFYDEAEVMAAQCIIDEVKVTHGLNRDKLLQSFLGPAFFQGNANACFLQSYCAHYDIGQKDVQYLEGFKDAARRGHPKAFYYLGLHFAKNKKTQKTAFQCYLEAAERGFVPAFSKLGICYKSGLGAARDPDEAYKWFDKAAKANDPEGIFQSACCYITGDGVGKDRKKAVELFQSAAAKASPRALLALLLLKENNSASSFFRGNDKAANDVSADKKKNTYLSRRAICLKYGIGVVKSPDKALRFLRQAQQDDPLALFELAESCESGSDKSKALYNALGYYKKAAALGNLCAAWKLGKLYSRLGNNIEAMLYYRQAADGGHAEAAFELAKLLRKAHGADRKTKLANVFKLIRKAAKNGCIQAFYELGDCYYKGDGVNKNLTLAAKCWKEYEDAFLKRRNNSIHGIYWGKLPFQRPIEYDANGLPKKYLSDLKDKKEILFYYKKY